MRDVPQRHRALAQIQTREHFRMRSPPGMMFFSSRRVLRSLRPLEIQALPPLESAGFAGKVQGPHQPEEVAQSSDEGPFGDDCRFQLIASVSALMGRTDLASHAEIFKGSALFMNHWPGAYANVTSTEWKRLTMLLEANGSCSHRTLRELPDPAVACGRAVPCTAWDYNLLAKQAILQENSQ
ncbi:uncharacterized protein LOC144115705 [Amblyomma americanum]